MMQTASWCFRFCSLSSSFFFFCSLVGVCARMRFTENRAKHTHYIHTHIHSRVVWGWGRSEMFLLQKTLQLCAKYFSLFSHTLFLRFHTCTLCTQLLYIWVLEMRTTFSTFFFACAFAHSFTPRMYVICKRLDWLSIEGRKKNEIFRLWCMISSCSLIIFFFCLLTCSFANWISLGRENWYGRIFAKNKMALDGERRK